MSRVDDIDDAARALFAGMSAALRAEGKAGYLVDPDGIVIRTEPEYEAIRFPTVDDAVARPSVRARGLLRVAGHAPCPRQTGVASRVGSS